MTFPVEAPPARAIIEAMADDDTHTDADADDGDADAELAQQLATRAMSLVRAGAEPQAAVAVLLGFARGRPRAVDLARARCAAAVDQDPRDRAAADAVALLQRTRAQLA